MPLCLVSVRYPANESSIGFIFTSTTTWLQMSTISKVQKMRLVTQHVWKKPLVKCQLFYSITTIRYKFTRKTRVTGIILEWFCLSTCQCWREPRVLIRVAPNYPFTLSGHALTGASWLAIWWTRFISHQIWTLHVRILVEKKERRCIRWKDWRGMWKRWTKLIKHFQHPSWKICWKCWSVERNRGKIRKCAQTSSEFLAHIKFGRENIFKFLKGHYTFVVNRT